ncbi:MAG: glycerophosphodiester phosphodiesterase family protein [Pseudomonadota bacterium]|nr:glycerophosphodiester phosphodiesterase family protein [Pseudomonadota bacterium]
MSRTFGFRLPTCRLIAFMLALLTFTPFGFAASDGHRKHADPSAESTLGPRPGYLVDDMDPGLLKHRLSQCEGQQVRSTPFSIGHRGAPLQFPEHTKESYVAAARMGAGIIECDVTFTADRELVCRHSQCDLHTTTNILETPLAAKCSVPFQPAVLDPDTGAVIEPAKARCCTSDITLAEFRTLSGKMDGADPAATTAAEYMNGTANWRTDLYANRGTLMTHAESIELIRELGAGFTPELKSPEVSMPFDGDYDQAAYASQMITEYIAAGVDPKDVWPQSFNQSDVLYWIAEHPEFAMQAVYLDDANTPGDLPSLAELQAYAAAGIRIVAPPLWALLDTNHRGRIVPSDYARAAKQAGLGLITWTLERSGPLAGGGGWYHQTVTSAINNDGDTFKVLDVLARRVGVIGVFSDWPATTTYYANCLLDRSR